jgi:hypothetical protein
MRSSKQASARTVLRGHGETGSSKVGGFSSLAGETRDEGRKQAQQNFLEVALAPLGSFAVTQLIYPVL